MNARAAQDVALEFFETARRLFESARDARPVENFFAAGPSILRVISARAPLAEKLLPALAHLSIPPARADWTVLMWDDVSTGTRMPPPPWDWNTARGQRGEILGYNTARIFTVYDSDAGALHLLDAATRTALYWTHDARRLPGYEVSAPLRTILHWFAQTQNMQLIHGGAVGTTDAGVLLAGKGGMGKSTTALACLDSELLYAGDDYCLIQNEPQPAVHSLYSSAKLNADSIARLPQLAAFIANPNALSREKAILFLAEQWRAKLSRGFPLVALVLPRVRDGRDTTLAPATRHDALRALGISTLIQLPRAEESAARRIQALARALPCYTLHLGTDLAQIPRRIAELISELAP
jgi:hypothetical protein